ncbi:tRNA epoxyqueuosine(34) reductase QueG [Rubellimicrobium sp. CFH 75288]|uniref:tRNA epoxyqueuosine(34) reductase QueG n=1 Tax=Rubellimicrobium sp. CFH 75288 TaxID=2697034 RepID=UPI0014134708|nr:tRNA epoxyqueuosine(34) reductase QueG [Rubellimicrobium sp. CFH 75288]NAZ37403.1 tRNA epoxyqueuosine(34) reductase QueG [Rubellimicrobium sp. CFH 75288]
MRTSTSDGAALKAALAEQARAAGFAAMGVCRPDAIPEAMERLRAFLAAGHHGQMAWMAERAQWRGDPRALWPEARSIVMLADSYAPRTDPLAVLGRRDRAAISVYAKGRDYHDSVKPRLKRLLRWLLGQAPGHAGKVFVDTAPVMEKPLAQAAGLGWQGKHTNLLGRGFGNWVFLGAIFTTLDLPPDPPEREHCGTCTRCLEVCPTDAFPAPFRLDARRCLSYLTIEHRGPIPEAFRAPLGNRVFGCDDCLAVCPWNKFAVAASEMRYRPDAEAPPLAEMAALDEAAFRARFAGTPVRRIGHARFLRNVLYAIGNSGDPALAPAAAAHRDAADPAVADAARWSLSRLRDRA